MFIISRLVVLESFMSAKIDHIDFGSVLFQLTKLNVAWQTNNSHGSLMA